MQSVISCRLWMVVACAACGSDARVQGDYTIALTNRDNGCNFTNWTVGRQADVPVRITQNDGAVTADVQGLAAVYLDLLVGDHVYRGSIAGDDLALDIQGTVGHAIGNCVFTYNSTFEAQANGDTMSGRIEYRAATNNQPDCGAITNCLTFQEWNGTRPPP